MNEQDPVLKIVGPKDRFPEVILVPTVKSGYLMLSCEVDHRPPIGFFLQSKHKTQLIGDLKALASALSENEAVLDAAVFKAFLVPPGRGTLLKERPNVEIARFDVVLLIEFVDLQSAQDFASTTQWTEALTDAEKIARKTLTIVASNVRRIGSVDHSRDGVFLFNYFYADSLDVNLAVWKYTAGWFQDQTDLDNSTVLLPEGETDSSYTIINHCRWDRLRDILPHLVFNKTFGPFVLANFLANNTAAMPILYRLA